MLSYAQKTDPERKRGMSKFHHGFYHFMRALIKPYFATFGRYSWEEYTPKSKTYLVLMNHNTNYDFFLAGLSLKKHMYFVASEHILRLGIASWFIRTLADPIPRKKGAESSETVDLILDRLHSGENVCMMVEGNRSFNGETGWISPNNVPLIRQSEAGVVTYTIHGGYFVNPRWSKKQRRGRMWGVTVNEYTPEMLSDMSDEEILSALRKDIYVNAYEDQAEKMYPYETRKPAEDLETALFICPKCRSMGTMKSRRNRFFCSSCGASQIFNKYGYFEKDAASPSAEEVPFRTVYEWDKFQRSCLKNYLTTLPEGYDEPIFTDANITLSSIGSDHTSKPLIKGEVKLYTNRISITDRDNTIEIPISGIRYMSVAVECKLLFSTEDNYYQLTSDKPYSALKYMMSWYYLRGKEYV